MLLNFTSVATTLYRTQKSRFLTTYVVDMVVEAVLFIIFFKTDGTPIRLCSDLI